MSNDIFDAYGSFEASHKFNYFAPKHVAAVQIHTRKLVLERQLELESQYVMGDLQTQVRCRVLIVHMFQ